MKKRCIVLAVFIVLLVGIVIYTIIDNNRINIVSEEILIDKLPKEFHDFTILQISDLHSKEFGENQKKLLEKINSIEYDMVAFTGDMLQDREQSTKQLENLIKGLKNKENIYWVNGNTGPFLYDEATGKISYEGEKFQELGVKFLNEVNKININGESIYISDGSIISNYIPTEGQRREEQIKYRAYTERQLSNIPSDGVHIALSHYPLGEEGLKKLSDSKELITHYNLIIAGHYHGGQIRLPIIGALYVPNINSFKDGVLPDEELVSGLYKYGDVNQYISKGLGASDKSIISSFRMFNTPEINVLILKCN